jgi:hypothetical protein
MRFLASGYFHHELTRVTPTLFRIQSQIRGYVLKNMNKQCLRHCSYGICIWHMAPANAEPVVSEKPWIEQQRCLRHRSCHNICF